MARRKKSRRKRKKKLPIFATAGFAAYGYNAYNQYVTKGGGKTGTDYALTNLMGVRLGEAAEAHGGNWDTSVFMSVWTPPVIGILGSTVASKLGANKYLSRIPLVGDFLSF